MSKNPPPSGIGRLRRGEPGVRPKNMGGTLYRLWQMTQGSRRGLGWIFLLSGLASGSAILFPYLIGNIVSSIDDRSPASQMIWLLAAAYIGDWLVRFLQQYHMASLGQRMILYIRTNLFNYMKGLPLGFFDSRQHGELMSRLTNDVDNISTTISGSLTQMIMYGFTIIGIFFVMLWMNVLLTAIVMLSIVFIYLLTKTITKRTRKLFREQQAILGKLNGQVEESISGLTMVKAFCREEAMMKEFVENNDRFCEVAVKAQIWSGYLMPITNVINNLNYVLIAMISGIMASTGNLAIGTITSFLLYSRQFSRPFVDIASIYNNFQTAMAGAERIFEILDEEPEPEDVTEPVLTNPKGEIRFEDVSFGYIPGQTVL
ncbi:MAG: multidrug ABC transporter ATP-binding protein, partial [Clostridiales bacterium]|nr:multidrug ABC transporter ATP-binding protein [Clostridiales bacterium]